MAVFLTIHARYNDVQMGIFRDGNLIELASDESKKVSKNFIVLLDRLLKNNKLALSDLSFIAAHLGPAPFTTLRVTLASVNGFAFATGIPLVGINGIEAFVEAHKNTRRVTVALLNAFCHEIYYGIDDPTTHTTTYGYAPADLFIKELAQTYEDEVTFIGNGIELYKEQIATEFGSRALYVDEPLVSLETLAQHALKKYEQKETNTHLMPLYLKKYAAPSRAFVEQ